MAPSKRDQSESVAELLLRLYSDAPKSRASSGGAGSTIGELSEEEERALLDLASRDSTLQKTKQVLLLSLKANRRAVAGQLCAFCRAVLLRHPVSALEPVRRVLSEPHSGSWEAACEAIMQQDYGDANPDSTTEGPLALRKQDRVNALISILTLGWSLGSVSLTQAEHVLRRHVWSTVGGRTGEEFKLLEILLSSRDLRALAVTSDLLKAEMGRLRGAVVESERQRRSAETRAESLNAELSRLREASARVDGEVSALRQQLEQGSEEHEVVLTHLRDDLENLRARLLRRIDSDTSLLEAGLSALRREPPKVPVMVDHAERVIEALRRERSHICKGEK